MHEEDGIYLWTGSDSRYSDGCFSMLLTKILDSILNNGKLFEIEKQLNIYFKLFAIIVPFLMIKTYKSNIDFSCMLYVSLRSY